MTTQTDPPEHPTSTLLLAVTFPADGIPNADVDPEQVADELVHILNEERIRNGCPSGERLMVAGIPAAQWLTRRTLDNLRKAASHEHH